MAGEAKQTYATKELDTESYQEEKSPATEQLDEKALKGSSENFQNGSVEAQTVNNNVPKFVEKEKDNIQQREAVIRPQQAGKIDFKSLQNRSKFSSDGTWPSGKSSPQSPSGKSRNRDKGKKSGKTERGNPQQLYRLSITNARSNPTIGIAYPQQKLSPPKKLDASRGPISGSYRFHVPSIPEREAELQQEEFTLNRCFQEGSSNLTSPSYTSQPAGSAVVGPSHQHPPSSAAQQPGALETSNTQPINQMLFPDFQLSGADMWQSPDRTFSNASFAVQSQKSNSAVDVSKANGFVPLPFQYGYPLLDDTVPDSFPCDHNSQPQHLIEASLGLNQVNQNSFSFQLSGEEQDIVQNNTQFSYEQSEDRPRYSIHSKPPQFVQASHGKSVHCTRSIGEDISSRESSESSNDQSDRINDSLSDKSDNYCPADARDAGVTVGGNRGGHPKSGPASQRIRIQGSVHQSRNNAQGQSPQMHFSKKAFNSQNPNIIPMGSATHDKSHSRVAQPWEGSNKAFTTSLDQNSTPYPFQCQPPLEQRQNTGINSRVPWQQKRLTAALPNQNRIELSRQISNPQMAFVLTQPDWKEDSKPQKSVTQKSPNNLCNNRSNEAFSKLRQDKHGCSIISHCQFINKVESSQSQVGDAKNKALYFGVNHAVHVSTPRTHSYPPLHVPAMDLMMVSPYDSPSHSPIHNQMSSSMCSSLSPDSTSPASISSDDSSNSKVSPHQFYNQHQGKASLDNLSSNQSHYHSELSRSLHYNQEKAKESFPSNSRHVKSNGEGGKGCMDNYVMDHHPPPPYSAHQLLATSLENLDQLDMLLTCKQCDKNFNNLSSFLDHKQYCGQHTFAQNDFKDVRKVEDTRKFHTEHTKGISSGTSFAMSRSSSDLHLSLLGLNKNGEIIPDGESKVDPKDDHMKLMLPSAPLPDLEMEDAKLDSLITEALNGLGYQSDNAEIDSSFMDAFGDDEITSTKCSTNKQTLKTKDSVMFESRSKHEFTSSEKSLKQGKYSMDSDLDCLSAEGKLVDIIHKDRHLESEPHEESTKEETTLLKRESASEGSTTHTEWVKETRKRDKSAEDNECGQRFLLSRKFSETGGIKTLHGSTSLVKAPIAQSPSTNKSPTSQRSAVRDGKRKRISGGSWSKELIHKIVQQKNKLHKLHVKGTKNMQFSLVMERVTPTIQNPTFREYDYVSDSDEDCEPVKIASQGRLSQSIRCRYTYTKECKGRIRADKNREGQWRQDKIESFESKRSEAVSPPSIKDISGHQRVRRRSSRSSTSSELSTSVSISSESISSPKSSDRTDSDCEKRVEIKKKDQELIEKERSPQRILKESSTSLALTFTKNTKHYSADKLLLSELKDSYTSTKCSNIISTTEETAEHTLTKSTVSLARIKTRVEVKENMDHYGCENGIAKSTEEPTPLTKDYKDHLQDSMHPRKPGVTLNPLKTNNNKEINHLSKIKTDNTSSKGKHKKREGWKSQEDSESKAAALESFSDDISLNKDSRAGQRDLSEPQSLCSSLMDEVCLSPSKDNNASPQKDRSCLMPYTLENDQSLMKSPISFDTSSMFADLTVSGFDNNLYPDIQLAKEGFSPMETTADKKELFESSFSPLLEQRDWNMIVDVTPELPDEIAQYKEDSDLTNDKKTCFNNVPFTMTEKIMDYHSNLNSCVSDDELEIKRIVTELESQIQSSKLRSPSPLDSEPSKHLTVSKFSPLRLDHESEADQSILEVVCPSESLALAAPTGSHSELFSETDLPWSSPVPFELMSGQQCLHTPTHLTVTDIPNNVVHDNMDVKGETDLNRLSSQSKAELNINEKTEGSDSLCIDTDKSEEMIEHEIYRENLMKSLEVISDSLSSGLESPQSPLQQDKYGADEEQEKQDNEKIETTNQTERVDFGYSVRQLMKCSTDLNKELLENPCDVVAHDICESQLNKAKENLNVGEGNEISLHHKDAHVNGLHHESTYKNDSVNDSEQSSNKLHLSDLPVTIFEHKTCESPVATREIGLDEQIIKDFNSQGLANSLNVTTAFLDGLKDESIVDHKQKIGQEMLIQTDGNEDYKGVLESVSANHSTQGSGTNMDTTERIKDHVDLGNSIIVDSIGSPHDRDAQSQVILQNDTEEVTTVKQSQMDEQKQYYKAVKATSYTTLPAEHLSCEENVQINLNEDSKLEPVSPVSPAPVIPPYVSSNSTPKQTEESQFRCCWTNIDIMTPALAEKAPAFQNSEGEGIVRSLHNCETSTRTTDVNIPFASHLDFAETTESKMSSNRQILRVNSISSQAFCELNEKSEPLVVTQIRDTLHELKLSPMSYSETHFNDSNLCSESLSKVVDGQPDIKSSPKDSLDSTACGLTLNEELSSNCRLSPIHVQNELELTTIDHFVKLDIPHFHDTTSENDISYISATHDHEECNASVNNKQHSKLHQGDMGMDTNYMDMHINLLRNTDDEHVDSQITAFKLDALSQRPTMSNVQEPINTNEPRPADSKSFRSVSTSLMGHSEVKTSPKKSCVQNAVQGKFQCEICLMYFRTAPGLKRHKAMKHTVKAEGKQMQSSTLSSQGLVKDSMGTLDPAILLHQEGHRIPAIQCDQTALDSVFEDTAKQSFVSKSTKGNDQEGSPPLTEKAKKNNKVKKSKSADINNEGFIHKLVKQDPFPDELLSILKTDIMQAISPDFPTMAQPECPKSPQKEMTNNLNCWNLKATEEDQGIESTCVDEQQVAAFSKSRELYNDVPEIEHATTNPEGCGNLKPSENNKQANALNEYAGIKECTGIKEICDPCTDPAIKCETTSYPRAETDIHCDGYKDQSLSPSGFGPDLKALFDDENTFSQLFPMNDEMKRKKCTRVYGKSNKKQKQMPSLISDSTGPEFLDKNEDYKEKTGHIFVSNLNDHCEYETILLDDAKMLEMCHKSTLKSSPQTSLPKDAIAHHQTDYENTAEVRNGDFLSETEVLNENSSVNLDGPEDTSIKSIGSTDAQESCHLPLVSMDDNVPHYPSIDIQKLNTTFQLPEIQFFEPERDLSLVEAISPKKSPKKAPERKGRKRIETGLKPKDKQYKCKVCFTWFLTLGELDFHKLSHNPSPPPTCYMCVQRKFSSREQLRDHLREKHVKNKAGMWTCGMCLKEITDVWMYNEHLREHATQFARKGQSQGSLLDMPGCFMQENAVKNFISSIMQHQSKKVIKGENAKSSKEEKKALLDDPELEQKSSDTGENESMKPKLNAVGGSKHAAFTPFEVLSREITQKNIEMHPNCKDPSRDCHHCGKQFPKPFKLQRHLVVHNLQKIFMCHKCPVSYQQANELKDHLKNEHEEVDEPDSKHTTLYTCELCADVMHVIKKSFICSTCNYTFSKKEQFDRHMEKHLAGANKIFKFKAVVRPCVPYKSKDDKFDMPPNKKRKVLAKNSQENSVDSDIANIAAIQLQQNSDTHAVSPVMENSTRNNTAEELTQTNNTCVKIEDVAEDLSGVLDELEQCQPQMDSAKHTHLSKTMPKEEDNAVSNAYEGQGMDTKETATENKSSQAELCDVKIEVDCGAIDSTSPIQISSESRIPEKKKKDECPAFANADETMEAEDSDQTSLQNPNQASKIMKGQGTEDPLTNDDASPKPKQPLPINELNQSRQDQMNECSSILRNKNEQAINQTEQLTCVLLKDRTSPKAEENKQCNDNSSKSGNLGVIDIAGVNQIKNPFSSVTTEDKGIVILKKRKAPKTIPNSPRTASAATRENLGIDPKVKKKFRPNASERLAGQRKADSCGDYLVLTSVKDDTASNKIVSKQKIGTLDMQPKRGPTDHFSPKKGELIRHMNWDCRSKKGVPRKHIHSATSKVSVTTLNNSFNKSRPKSGLKAVETHSYHTAESHNNVLSKLFGQRLTGFKIPLRKDTSEPIN